MREGFGDPHIDKLPDELTAAVKIDHSVIFRTPTELRRIFARGPFHQHAFDPSYHGPADLRSPLIEATLKDRQALLLMPFGDIIRHTRRRCSRPLAIDKAKGMVKTYVMNEVQGRGEVRLRLARKSHDEIRGNADLGPYLTQTPDLGFIFEHRVAPFHHRQDPVRAALHGQMQVINQLGYLGEDLNQSS